MNAGPEGLIIIPDFISASEEAALVKELLGDDKPWLDKSHLKFSNTFQQEYGACISDAMEVVIGGKVLTLPPKSLQMAKRIAEESARRKILDGPSFARAGTGFLRVNHYLSEGGGYMHKHMDSHKCFGPVIACCSLLSDAAMSFYDTKGNSFAMAKVHGKVEVSIPRRSLYFMTGPARFQWQHGIRKDQCPVERLSLTFRTVQPDAPVTKLKQTPKAKVKSKAKKTVSKSKTTTMKRPASRGALGVLK